MNFLQLPAFGSLDSLASRELSHFVYDAEASLDLSFNVWLKYRDSNPKYLFYWKGALPLSYILYNIFNYLEVRLL